MEELDVIIYLTLLQITQCVYRMHAVKEIICNLVQCAVRANTAISKYKIRVDIFSINA